MFGLGRRIIQDQGAPFTPAELPGIQFWLRSDNVTVSGTTVDGWPDQSGQGNNATIPGNHPVYVGSGGVNNLPYVNTTSDGILAIALTLVQPFEVFVVARATSTAGTAYLLDTSNNGNVLLQQAGGLTLAIYGGSVAPGPAFPGEFSDTSIDAIFDGASSSVAVNGGTATTLNPGPGSSNGVVTIAGYGAGGEGFTGWIYDIFAVTGVLSSSDRANVNAYFAARYGSPVAVPGVAGHVLHTGQSLCTGFEADTTPITQPYANIKLFDSSGTYDITDPTASTLSLIPLVSPQRTPQGENPYPDNIGGSGTGDTAEVAMANQFVSLFGGTGRTPFAVFASNVGQSGQPSTVIEKGGTGNAYAAGIYEADVLQRLASGLTPKPFFVMLTHGEQDGINYANEGTTSPSGYLSFVQSLQTDNEEDLNNTYSTTGTVPMLVSQCNITPGPFMGWGVSDNAVLVAAMTDPNTIIPVGPKYQFPHPFGDAHLGDYRPLGEKQAQAAWKYTNHQPTALCWMTGIVVSGTTVTITCNVPVGPLVADTTTVAQPHQTGWASAYWANSLGFEVWDNQLEVTSATNTAPIELGFSTAHGYTTGDVPIVEGVVVPNAANGFATVTVVDTMHVTLDGTTGNGPYFGVGGIAFTPVQVLSAVVTGNTVVLTLSRALNPNGWIAYAQHNDQQTYTGTLLTSPASGNIRDSDPFVGFSNVTPQTVYCNWLWSFRQQVT